MSACRIKIDSYLSTFTKLKSRLIKDLIINLTTLNLIEEKVGPTVIPKHAQTRVISEAKHGQTWLVLGWEKGKWAQETTS